MISSVNPYDQRLLRQYDRMAAEEIEAQLRCSERAFETWSELTVSQRLTYIEGLKVALLSKRAEAAACITQEMGKVLVESLAEIDKCVSLCDYYLHKAEDALSDRIIATDASNSGVLFKPLGCILGIMPWNFPFWQAFRFIIPTIIAGNTAILKHASNVTGCALLIQSLFAAAGFEEGVLTVLVVPGQAMEAVIRHEIVKGVSITGSEAAGRRVAQIAGDCLKPLVLELGGSDPFIVFEDADLEHAVTTAVLSRFSNAGQSCIAAKRFIIQAAVADRFATMLQKRLEGLAMGDPSLHNTTLAPLAMPQFLNELHAQVMQSIHEGAVLKCGGAAWSKHPGFYLPTLLDHVTPMMPAGKEELFGPVAAILRFDNLNEAIALANGTRFGLGATVFTEDADIAGLCLNKIAAGSVFINGLMKSHPALPFGGVKASGYGRELGIDGLMAFVNVKTFWKK